MQLLRIRIGKLRKVKWLQNCEQEFSLKTHISSHKILEQDTNLGSEIESKAVCFYLLGSFVGQVERNHTVCSGYWDGQLSNKLLRHNTLLFQILKAGIAMQLFYTHAVCKLNFVTPAEAALCPLSDLSLQERKQYLHH